MERLKTAPAHDNAARDALVANVELVAQRAEWISGQVIRRLPQYTLHDGTHLLNVLSIMEALLSAATVEKLTPLECALCILAAFTHDLGMVWTDEDVARYLDAPGSAENQEWLRHRDGYQEELRQIERWKQRESAARDANDTTEEVQARSRVNYLEGHLLAEFIRKKHTGDTGPILHWFKRLEDDAGNASLFRYGSFDFKRLLAQLAISHGQSIGWLREALVGSDQPDRFHRLAGGESVNFAFPGLLLRLADIMDFDISRAPTILFRHFGIENAVSILEWEKHMAISGWALNQQRLLYEAGECRHPIYEKAIRSFTRWIEEEIKSVREELMWQNRAIGQPESHYQLNLPELVQTRVTAANDADGRPVYQYRELQFQLDQHEIQNLLMGESLYEDPTLCLRELLQNSLDALQLRDIRNQVLAKDPEARLDWSDPLPAGEHYHVEVTWGRDEATDREYIRVSDNGSGMTRDQLERYFTNLGKSFYRSPEYERERQIFREHGHVVSPISIFGIGFLSCFMLAEEVCVRTRPGWANNADRAAYDLRISGPGSLFWLRDGTLMTQGTEVTIFLKPRFRLDLDTERSLTWLKAKNNYSGTDWTIISNIKKATDEGRIDPLLIVGIAVVWPLYPVRLSGDVHDPAFTVIDDRFHFERLAPIDSEQLVEEAVKWNFPTETVGQVRWGFMDWVDDSDPEATGTRIRIAHPANEQDTCATLPVETDDSSSPLPIYVLASLVEPQVAGIRNRVLVEGVSVGDMTVLQDLMLVAGHLGTRCWIDLRGAAAPRLTADRRKALSREDVDGWPAAVSGVFGRYAAWLQQEIDQNGLALSRPLLTLVSIGRKIRPRPRKASAEFQTAIDARHFNSNFLVWSSNSLRRDLTRNLDRARDLDLASTRAQDLRLGGARDLGLDACVLLARALNQDLNRDLNRDLADALNQDRDSVLDPGPDPNLDITLARDFARDLNEYWAIAWGATLSNHVLAEGFAADLANSLPALGVHGLTGRPGLGKLIAPGSIEWNADANASVQSYPDYNISGLDDWGYDLVFPFTNLPTADLRRKCPGWIEHRGYRALGVLPFLLLGQKEFFGKHSTASKRLFRRKQIFALLPELRLWSKPFPEWTDEDWQTCGLSALWDIESGEVYWAEGAQNAAEMKKVGLPIKQFLEKLAKKKPKKQKRTKKRR